MQSICAGVSSDKILIIAPAMPGSFVRFYRVKCENTLLPVNYVQRLGMRHAITIQMRFLRHMNHLNIAEASWPFPYLALSSFISPP